MKEQEKTEYLTLDLELRSDQDLTPLVEHFGEEVFLLHNGQVESKYYTSFEPKYFEPQDDTPENHAQHFLSLIEALPSNLRELWKTCDLKFFDFGFQSGFTPRPYFVDLSTATLQGIAAAGAMVRISIYPAEDAPNKVAAGRR